MLHRPLGWSRGLKMADTPQPKQLPTMGKQISVLRIKGSVGEVTGYRLNTSSKTSKSGDFIRSKAATVSNPRTYSQAAQRAKARPAQLFYAAFANVLNHAFFPLGKAVKNRNRFVSLAMRLPYVPDVKKGEAKLPFAPYQISEGALGFDSLCKGEYDVTNDSGIMFPLVYNEPIDVNDTTVGYFTDILLQNNQRLQDGQELTFLAVFANGNNPDERWAEHVSIVLNSNDKVTMLSDLFENTMDIVQNSEEGYLEITTKTGYKMLCAGLIISSETTGSWQYTNSFMALTAYAIDGFDWEEKDIIISYMNEVRDRDSDKILQQADNAAEGETVPIVSIGTAEITLKQGVTGTPNPTDAAIAEMRLGIRKVVVSERGQLQWYNGPAKTWTPVFLDSQSDRRPLTLADTAWAGSQTITVAECQAYGF